MNLCRCVGNTLAAAPNGVADLRRGRPAPDRQSELLSHELDTKILHVNLSCFVGEVDGGGFAPVVYEMPEVRL
jgi:hypothetical protein